MEAVVQQLPPGLEKLLAQGGKRYWYFSTDPRVQEKGLPVLVVTFDHNGKEVEYYHFDRMNANVGLRQEDFTPDVVWARKK
jgi:hypothetical protein